jgi:hypothetical protein
MAKRESAARGAGRACVAARTAASKPQMPNAALCKKLRRVRDKALVHLSRNLPEIRQRVGVHVPGIPERSTVFMWDCRSGAVGWGRGQGAKVTELQSVHAPDH